MDGKWVCLITATMHAFARPTNTLLVRAQSTRRLGMKSETSGSNAEPNPADKTVRRSMTEPESRLRSEFRAWLSGFEMERMPASISVENLHPP
jgi:hypothetical protein